MKFENEYPVKSDGNSNKAEGLLVMEAGDDTFLSCKDAESIECDERLSLRQRLENLYFSKAICTSIESVVEDDLYEAGFDEDFIASLREKVRALPLEDRKQILSYPAELRRKVFARWSDMASDDMANPDAMITFLLTNAQENHWSIGYHLSNRDIEPVIDERTGEVKKWDIVGYEPDHRNSDLPMAYYSLDYMHRYRNKGQMKYLYIVRAILSEDRDNVAGRHFMDYGNKWGRASALSVIHRVDMHAIEKEVSQKVEEALQMMEARKDKGEKEVL